MEWWQQNPVVTLGVAYTDARGKVVFANRQFLQMVTPKQIKSPVGEPLWKVLGFSDKQALGDLLDPKRDPDHGHLVMEIPRRGQLRNYILCVSEAAFDDNHNFIGTNITLGYLDKSSIPATEPVQAVAALAGQEPAEPEVAPVQHDLQEAYFLSVFTALQVLIARLAGPGIRRNLESVISKLAATNDWPVQIEETQVTIDPDGMQPDAYSALLGEALDYAIAIVGRRVMAYDIKRTCEQLDREMLEAANRSGIQSVIDSRL